jgi:hypothetical protein
LLRELDTLDEEAVPLRSDSQYVEAPLAQPTLGASRTQNSMRPRRAAFAAAIFCLSFLALGSGTLGMSTSARAGNIASTASSASATSPSLVPLEGPQRALMVSANGYALRVLVPLELVAQEPQPMTIEVWDPAGRPVSLPTLVVRFADEDGQAEGVTVPAGSTKGRYEVSRQFGDAGDYSMEVLTEEVALRVHFEVGEVADAPNS